MPWLSEAAAPETCRAVEVRAEVPLDDLHAWHLYPRHRWVYDLAELYSSTGRRWGPHGTKPAHFPCVVRPVLSVAREVNRLGHRWDGALMGAPGAGELWCSFQGGPRYALDLAVEAGSARRSVVSRRDAGAEDWQRAQQTMAWFKPNPTDWVAEVLDGFTGMVSLYYESSSLALVSLRASERVPTYGPEFLRAVARLHDDGRWKDPGR